MVSPVCHPQSICVPHAWLCSPMVSTYHIHPTPPTFPPPSTLHPLHIPLSPPLFTNKLVLLYSLPCVSLSYTPLASIPPSPHHFPTTHHPTFHPLLASFVPPTMTPRQYSPYTSLLLPTSNYHPPSFNPNSFPLISPSIPPFSLFLLFFHPSLSKCAWCYKSEKVKVKWKWELDR